MSEPAEAEADGILISAIAAADAAPPAASDALAALYDTHAAWMLGQAHRALGNRRDAEDLVHDVFLEVWRKAGSYDPRRGSVRTWLGVKLRSRAIDRMRSRAVARRNGVRRLVDGDDAPDPESAGELLRSVDRTRALAALAGLPDAQREVIEMSYLEGIGAREIAERCGVAEGTVKSRLARGLAVLRDRLCAEGAGS